MRFDRSDDTAAVALEVTDLSVAYGKVEALHHASLKVPAGSIVTVIGPNGAGKTTLLNAVMGLLPARGEVRYEGVSITHTEVEARVAHGLCLVPERRELFARDDGGRQPDAGRFPAPPAARARHRRRPRGGVRALPAAARAPRSSSPARCRAASARCSRSAAR